MQQLCIHMFLLLMLQPSELASREQCCMLPGNCSAVHGLHAGLARWVAQGHEQAGLACVLHSLQDMNAGLKAV